MSKLYPPYIEGSIPAFSDTARGTVLTVPFSMNRAVSKSEISGFSLALKTIQQDKYLIQDSSEIYTTYDLEKQEVYFNLNNIKDKLKIGQHYKIQIAYRDNKGIIGYYSTVGIVKYTAAPIVEINNLEKNTINKHIYNYVGTYNSSKDITEKVYSYKFVIYDNNNNLIYDTDFLIHNNSNNLNAYESYDEFLYSSDLEINKNYYIRYIVKTNNNMIVQSPKYKIIQNQSVAPDVNTKPLLELDFDNGYVNITLDNTNFKNEETGEEIAVSGAFVISRTTDLVNWENIYKFSLLGEYLSKFAWKDFTVEQGKKYIYSIQQYNDYELYSERILSDEIYVDFEDAFLFDGKRQLKIRYNPKINSFKTNHLESKIDTIGSKYPFIFRNGDVAYKEFPIAGLISYQMDEANLFMTMNNLVNSEKRVWQDDLNVKTTNLVGYNISAERDFKLEVLDWLNNGEPKLFRSPSEGNYIVRLMNVSLTPEDNLGRMLHTFNSTAYEITDYNYENLNNYSFISIQEPEIIQDRWMTVDLSKKSLPDIRNSEKIELTLHNNINSIYFYDMTPGDVVYIDGQKIVIGSTGTYKLNIDTIIQSIQIPTGIKYSGFLTYNYKDSAKNTFNTLINVNINDVPAKQFIGRNENILSEIEDIKKKVLNFYYLLFEKRNVGYGYAKWEDNKIYREKNKIILYRDANYTQKINQHDLGELNIFEDPLLLYHYKQDKLDIITDNNKSIILESYSKIKWPIDEYDKQIAQKQFAEELAARLKIYYIKVNGRYIPAATNFNEDLIYYEKKPFDCYWDPFDETVIYLTEDSYEQIQDFEKENNCKVLTNIQIHTNKAWIDDNEIDVTDSNYYIIKSLSDFKNIKLSNGIVLSCGYQLQHIVYGEEKKLKDYELLQNLQKLLNTVYLDSVQNTESFYELINDCNLNVILPQRYDIIIDAANQKLKEIYPKYIEELKQEVYK